MKEWTLPFIVKETGSVLFGEGRKTHREIFARVYRQAEELLRLHENALTPESREMVRALATLGNQGFARRRLLLLKHRFFAGGIVRDLGRLWAI